MLTKAVGREQNRESFVGEKKRNSYNPPSDQDVVTRLE